MPRLFDIRPLRCRAKHGWQPYQSGPDFSRPRAGRTYRGSAKRIRRIKWQEHTPASFVALLVAGLVMVLAYLLADDASGSRPSSRRTSERGPTAEARHLGAAAFTPPAPVSEARNVPTRPGIYANKCRSELCRNCVRSPRNRRQTPTFTGSHREAFCGGKSLNRLREELFQYHSVSVAGIVFQACSFNHSDISPL